MKVLLPFIHAVSIIKQCKAVYLHVSVDDDVAGIVAVVVVD